MYRYNFEIRILVGLETFKILSVYILPLGDSGYRAMCVNKIHPINIMSIIKSTVQCTYLYTTIAGPVLRPVLEETRRQQCLDDLKTCNYH